MPIDDEHRRELAKLRADNARAEADSIKWLAVCGVILLFVLLIR